MTSNNKDSLSVFLVLDPAEDLEFLDSVLAEVFPDGIPEKDESKVLAVLRFVTASLTFADASGTATELLRGGAAICSGRALVLMTLLRRLRMPARYTSCMNVPIMKSHAAVEVHYEGSWHFLDPTFGIFLYSRPDYRSDGHVLSLREAISFPDHLVFFKTVKRPGVGRFNDDIRSAGVLPVEPDYLATEYGRAVPDFYHQMLDTVFPVAYSRNDPLSMPVDVDLTRQPAVEFQPAKWVRDTDPAFRRFTGGHYLSDNGVPPMYHTWFVRTHGPQRFLVTYSISGQGSIRIEPLRAVVVVNTIQQHDSFRVCLRATDELASFSIRCDNGFFAVSSISVCGA